jgi:hypothetical protein
MLFLEHLLPTPTPHQQEGFPISFPTTMMNICTWMCTHPSVPTIDSINLIPYPASSPIRQPYLTSITTTTNIHTHVHTHTHTHTPPSLPHTQIHFPYHTRTVPRHPYHTEAYRPYDHTTYLSLVLPHTPPTHKQNNYPPQNTFSPEFWRLILSPWLVINTKYLLSPYLTMSWPLHDTVSFFISVLHSTLHMVGPDKYFWVNKWLDSSVHMCQ